MRENHKKNGENFLAVASIFHLDRGFEKYLDYESLAVVGDKLFVLTLNLHNEMEHLEVAEMRAMESFRRPISRFARLWDSSFMLIPKDSSSSSRIMAVLMASHEFQSGLLLFIIHTNYLEDQKLAEKIREKMRSCGYDPDLCHMLALKCIVLEEMQEVPEKK